MRVNFRAGQILPTFDSTITLLNRLKYSDSATKQDVWFKTVLHNCAWTSQLVRSVTGTQVSVGASYIARIPKNDAYKPYSEWVRDNIGFTFSTGDYVIKGEIEEEIINQNNIKQIVQKYRPNAFEIRLFKDNTGTVELAEHYHIEGV